MRSLLGRFHRPNARSQSEQLLMLNNLGDGSTLSLDFTAMGGTLDSRLTFTRSTTATYINSSGYVTSAAIDAPRFDYDPTTLTPRGLLIEGSATNLLNWSESFATSGGTNNNWADTNLTRTSTNNISPRNDATALRITASTGNGTVISSAAMGTSAERTFSIWLRRVIGTGNIQYTLDNGSTYTTQAITSSWVRYTFAATTAAQRVGIRIVTSGDSIELWGAQLEASAGASSYIPTGASQGTRAEDGVVLSNLSGIAFNQSAGTIYSQLEIVEKSRGSFVPYGSFDTSGGGRCWWWLRHNHDTSVGQRILGNAFNSGGVAAITSSNYTHSSGVFKFATSLDPVAGRMVYAIAGGSAQVTSASGFTLATAAQMSLNKNSDVTATDLGSMWIRTIKYWPTALPDATLQSITT